ncbi:MAG: hypothetical protein K0B37_06400 [Bacteroidales bacterium]|nr:hypothetical protein [Bacteroidales bacterium]
MRLHLIVLSILVIPFLVACNEEEPEVILPPVAAFETEKEIYDQGEPIEFFNLSENAESFLWTFGADDTSTEENPVFTPVFPSQAQGYGFRVRLVAMGADGATDTTESFVRASKRTLRTITITEMAESIIDEIPFEDGKVTELYLLTGLPHDPYDWINEYQTYPAKTIEDEFTLPYDFYISPGWPDVYMGNQQWIFHFHASVQGSDEVVSVKRIVFNPTHHDWYETEQGYRAFEIGDDEITIKVRFLYFD